MQSSNIYDTDWSKLAAWLTPKPFQKVRLGIIIRASLFPFIWLHEQFLKYRDAKTYQLTITPQVCYLERMLNDRFDSGLRRIRIDDAAWHLPWFIYQEEELKPQGLFLEEENQPKALYSEGESGDALNDFVVLVPTAVTFNEPEMRALLDSYYLFGTSYTIQKV